MVSAYQVIVAVRVAVAESGAGRSVAGRSKQVNRANRQESRAEQGGAGKADKAARSLNRQGGQDSRLGQTGQLAGWQGRQGRQGSTAGQDRHYKHQATIMDTNTGSLNIVR